MHALLQQQDALLQQIANRLQVNARGEAMFQSQEKLSSCIAQAPSESGGESMYDNMIFPNMHKRTKSVRDTSTERPKSIRI